MQLKEMRHMHNYNLGVLLRRKGRFKESVESYKKAIHKTPVTSKLTII